MFSKFVPYEDCNASVNLATKSNNNIYSEILFARIIIGINRINLSLSYAYSYSYKQESVVTKQRSATIYKEFEQDKTKDMGMGWPKNPNEFIDYLTDTIVLAQSNNPEKTMGMLVAGKGLVWFTDSDGIRWTLKE